MRVIFFVDGFNLYHSIDAFGQENYKWLNLRKLAERFLGPEEKIEAIYYFTAYCTWDFEKQKRHKEYVKALSHAGVRIILGNYQSVTKRFVKNKTEIVYPPNLDLKILPHEIRFRTFEEKKTDVNIAIKIAENAFKGNFEKAYILTGDSDLVPAIKLIRKEFPSITFTNILPINGKVGSQIQKICHERLIMSEEDLKHCLFDEKITTKVGIIEKPIQWS